jgi:hypothetical protein
MDRLIGLPLLHKLAATGIAVAFIVAYTVSSINLPPQEYTSAALLFFDKTAVAKLDPSGMRIDQKHPDGLAKLILSDKVIDVLCRNLGLSSDANGGQGAESRSHLTLSDESTSSLRIGWRGNDRKQTMAITNAMAVLLSSWIPTNAMRQNPEPAPSDTVPPPRSTTHAEPTPTIVGAEAVLRRVNAQLETVLNKQKELRSALAAADQRLAALGEESHRLETSIAQINAERQTATSARQPLIAQLATEKKNLDTLRERYTDAYPDVEAAQERVADIEEQLAAFPAVRPFPVDERSRLNSMTSEMKRLGMEKSRLLAQSLMEDKLETNLRRQENAMQAARPVLAPLEPQLTQTNPVVAAPAPSTSRAQNSQTGDPAEGDQVRPFKVLERATDAQLVSDPGRQFGWTIAIAGPICEMLYLLWAIWRFRVVHNEETLEKIVPGNVAYLGAIPGINTWRHNI